MKSANKIIYCNYSDCENDMDGNPTGVNIQQLFLHFRSTVIQWVEAI